MLLVFFFLFDLLTSSIIYTTILVSELWKKLIKGICGVKKNKTIFNKKEKLVSYAKDFY